MKIVGTKWLAVALVATVVAGCTATGVSRQGGAPETSAPAGQPMTIETSVADGATDVAVDQQVHVDGLDGTLDAVSLVSQDGKYTVKGSQHGVRWTADGFLEPGTTYLLKASGTGDDGKDVTSTTRFSTRALSLDEMTYPSVAPLQGETVGVGMPVIVTFDIPVSDRAAFERRMHVTAKPATQGGWYWLSDSTVHWRPKGYWKAGTKVSVDLDLNSVPAGNGIYGQQDQHVDFTVGRKAVSIVNTKTFSLTYKVDDRTVRTIPVSTGDADHRSRGGIKVIMEKFDTVDMDAATTGVDSDDPGYYNMKGVKWAMRVTNSGEFLHAAPWSVAYQGNANVSHGCVGMSTDNAGWLYRQSRRGDIVKYVGSPRRLEPGNGWTDWNRSWREWQEGSALQDEAADEASGA